MDVTMRIRSSCNIGEILNSAILRISLYGGVSIGAKRNFSLLVEKFDKRCVIEGASLLKV